MGSNVDAAGGRPANVLSMRDEFGGQMTLAGETAAATMAAQRTAQVQARYVMAMRNPRSVAQSRATILARCEIPGFAKEAWFQLPRRDENGKPIAGLTIRFAEEAARAWRNLEVQISTVYDGPSSRIVQVSVTDLESNLIEQRDVTVPKRVERKSPAGRVVLGERTNSNGDRIYIVECTDGEMAALEGAMISKAKRNAILAMIDPDIIGEAREVILATKDNEAAVDPNAHRKRVADGFHQLGIEPRHLAEYLGRPLDAAPAHDLVALEGLLVALKGGQTTWDEALEARGEELAAREAARANGERAQAAAAKVKQEATRHQNGHANGKSNGQVIDTQATPVVDEAPAEEGPGLSVKEFWDALKPINARTKLSSQDVTRYVQETYGKHVKDLTGAQRADVVTAIEDGARPAGKEQSR